MASKEQCSACGESNPAGSAFCVLCGTFLGWEQPGQELDETAVTPAPRVSPPPRGSASGGPPPFTPSQSRPPPAAAPAPPAADPLSSVTSGQCPRCGTPNTSIRRFCSRCGQPLGAIAPSPHAGPASTPGRWHSPQRAARRKYRRSLPAFYRWRRAVVVLLSTTLVVVVVLVMGQDPVGWVKDRWYDLRGTTQPVAGVQAVAKVPGSSKSAPMDAVTDRDPATVWRRTWVAGTAPTVKCAQAEAAGYVDLTWKPPTRVRMLQVDAGLAEGENDRDLEFRPETILVSYRAASSNRVCRAFTLLDTGARSSVELDTTGPVTHLRISIGAVFGSTTPDEDGPVSIRRLIVRSRPE